jgi:drug/metabolite transporter (DMT)-like permease
LGWTLLSILLSSLLVILFRVLRRYRVHVLQTVVFNYWVCVLIGLAITPGYWAWAARLPAGAWGLAVLQGGLFLGSFFLIGYASTRVGLAYAGMLSKMSVILPTLASFLFFGDAMPWTRWLGVGLAFVAVYLLHLPYLRAGQLEAKHVLLLSLLLLIGTGLADTNLKVFDYYYGQQVPEFVFTITLFGVAAVLGSLVLLIRWGLGLGSPQLRNVLSGLVLGVPNYFSIIVLLLALRQVAGTLFFPLNNVGQLLIISLAGIVLFRERYPPLSWLGLGLAMVAILLVSLA